MDECPSRCRIIMVDRVLIIYFIMKCDIWIVVLYRSRSNVEK